MNDLIYNTMKTFENYNNDENYLINIIHPSNIVIKFDFIEYTNHLLYFYDDSYIFSFHKKTNMLNINIILYSDINNKKLFHILPDFMQKHFDIKYKDIVSNSINTCNNISIKINK